MSVPTTSITTVILEPFDNWSETEFSVLELTTPQTGNGTDGAGKRAAALRRLGQMAATRDERIDWELLARVDEGVWETQSADE